MGSLLNALPKNTYGDLLQAANGNAGVPTTLQQIQDGLGNGTGLFLSQTQIGVGGSDVALARVAAQVMKPTNGSSGNGWIQNPAGAAALAANFTNNTATLNATHISLTVLAGRSYVIRGFLAFGNSTTTEGAKADLGGGTATATAYVAAAWYVGGGTISSSGATSLTSTFFTAATVASAEGSFVAVNGYLKVNAGGTVVLRFAENTSSTGTATLYAGSWLSFEDVVTL